MQVLEVSLRNIRSYEELHISFQQGVTLLTGDIGAGKSSILQAIEFSLFGTQAGELRGDSLLRHGSDEGTVSVLFSINNQEVRVQRTLKRSKDGVRQSDGELSINGSTEELSAVELKARVLALLGYPDQLLTKSKGLIFRYTVYTPQEEMKHILFMQPQERLNTLRLLFGIDKYKTIKENTQLFLKELRSEERVLLAQAMLAPQLERDVLQHETEAVKANAALKHASEQTEHAKHSLQQARLHNQSVQRAWEDQHKLREQRQLLANKIRELGRSVHNSHEDAKRIDEYLAVPLHAMHDVSHELEQTRNELTSTDESLLVLTKELGEHKGHARLLSEQAQNIEHLATCPVCLQQVTLEHKHAIQESTSHKTAQAHALMSDLASREAHLRRLKNSLQERITSLTELQRKFAGYQRELLHRKEQELQKERLAERSQEILKEKTACESELSALPLPDESVQMQYSASQSKLELADALHTEKLALLSQAQQICTRLEAQLTISRERLAQAKEAQDRASTLQERKAWLEEHFLELISIIEQHVLTSVHAEFRELFQNWFGKLIEDDTIQVSLGEEFEPLVSQNGYDSSLEQLSGGEKTAVALAYRLSLYKVVSDFLGSIATKDLLILDEPTDGFSSEQLERVKDVLRELSCQQVILVSHETQMESLCDHVIRIRKTNHRSSY